MTKEVPGVNPKLDAMCEMLKTIHDLKERIKILEKQIERMKCCSNCRHSRTEYEHCKTDKHEKWEIKKNEKIIAKVQTEEQRDFLLEN